MRMKDDGISTTGLGNACTSSSFWLGHQVFISWIPILKNLPRRFLFDSNTYLRFVSFTMIPWTLLHYISLARCDFDKYRLRIINRAFPSHSDKNVLFDEFFYFTYSSGTRNSADRLTVSSIASSAGLIILGPRQTRQYATL
jgi:hypothetical protein